ncbi:MAG: phosphoribosylformylglycinamidine cyclo-ligase, partial [Parvularculaceae bacterium]
VLREGVAAEVIAGIARGCIESGCALIGGETAEMPGMYAEGEYDLAGFCVGAVERENLLPRVCGAGDVLIGLASSGAHSNGYSLIRKIVSDAGLSYESPAPFHPALSLGDALLAPTRLYVKALLPLLKDPSVRGFAHITGGGLTDNVPRVFDEALAARFDDSALALPPLFDWLKREGGLSTDDMRRTFNCGIGGVIVADKASAERLMALLVEAGELPRLIGDLVRA